MKKNIEELINKYLDNELDPAGVNELNNLLTDDEDSLKELKAYKTVEHALREMELDDAPAGTTPRVMHRIATAKKVKSSNWFFKAVISFFITGIAASLFIAIKNYHPSDKEIIPQQTVDSVSNFIGEKTHIFSSIFSGDDVKLIGTVVTLLLIVTGYFIFETHRNFRNKLKSL